MNGILWTHGEKPCLNHWYRMIKDDDFLKIVKDYHNEEENITYYKIVEYRQGDNLYTGKTLARARTIMRELTYRRADNGL